MSATVTSEAERKAFGRWIRSRRRAMRMTQQTLAACAGTKQQAISALELGIILPSRPLRDALCEALNIPLEEMLEHDPRPPESVATERRNTHAFYT